MHSQGRSRQRLTRITSPAIDLVRDAAFLVGAAAAFVVIAPLALLAASATERAWDEAIAQSEAGQTGERTA